MKVTLSQKAPWNARLGNPYRTRWALVAGRRFKVSATHLNDVWTVEEVDEDGRWHEGGQMAICMTLAEARQAIADIAAGLDPAAESAKRSEAEAAARSAETAAFIAQMEAEAEATIARYEAEAASEAAAEAADSPAEPAVPAPNGRWQNLGTGYLHPDGLAFLERGAPMVGGKTDAWIIWYRVDDAAVQVDGTYASVRFDDPRGTIRGLEATRLTAVVGASPEGYTRPAGPWYVHGNDAGSLGEAKYTATTVLAEWAEAAR